MDTLSTCNNIYPNIIKLLKILLTLPISTEITKKSFSSSKIIKTYLRNTMSQVSFSFKYF